MKYLRSALLVSCLSFFAHIAHSQELGLRYGSTLGSGGNLAVDAMFGMGKSGRIHGDLVFGNRNYGSTGGIGFEVLWDFLYGNLGDEAFQYYVGAGMAVFFGTPSFWGLNGEAGLEYHFKGAPIALGVDFRPTFVLIEKADLYAGFGFNARYVFGKK